MGFVNNPDVEKVKQFYLERQVALLQHGFNII